MYQSLEQKPEFTEILSKEAENILKTNSPVSVGTQFDSADSFSFLLTTATDEKYVGKIFRFNEWPPKNKIETVDKLLAQNNISHEEIIYITHHHPVFTFGWQISKYISGGTANDLLKSDEITKKQYYEELGKLLKNVHEIKVTKCGSVQDLSNQFDTFEGLTQYELSNQSFLELPNEFLKEKSILDKATAEILNIVSGYKNADFTLVHDDAGAKNILWNYGKPILIDWTDSVLGPSTRDFATLTFREDTKVLPFIEKGYEKIISLDELYLHQLMRFIRLTHFYFFEGRKLTEFKLMVDRANILMETKRPFGL